MRVALVSQEYPPETAGGGIGSQTYAKAQGLTALGHEVHVISRSPTALRCEYRDGDISITRIADLHRRAAADDPARDWLAYSAAVAVEVASLHARLPLDVVDFAEYGGEGYVHLLDRPRTNRIPTVVQIHGPVAMLAQMMGWPEPGSTLHRAATEMERGCLLRADAVCSSSAYSANWCVRSYGLDPRRIPVLHTGVDTEEFFPRPARKESKPTIVFAGRITRNKGVCVLVEAACRLGREFPGLTVRLLGRGDERLLRELRDQSIRRGLPELLDLPGFFDHCDLPEQLSRAHVYAGPSFAEGGPGLSYLEAMACGLPVVASAGTGAAEVVVAGKTGLLAQPGDVDGVAAALRRLLADPSLREAMGARGREHVREQADSRHCLRRLAAFYESVVSGTERSAPHPQVPDIDRA